VEDLRQKKKLQEEAVAEEKGKVAVAQAERRLQGKNMELELQETLAETARLQAERTACKEDIVRCEGECLRAEQAWMAYSTEMLKEFKPLDDALDKREEAVVKKEANLNAILNVRMDKG
jgi:hypothetical protein